MKRAVLVVMALVLVFGVVTHAADNPLTSLGVHKTELGPGVSFGTSSQLGEVKWTLAGQRTVDNERYEYHEQNQFGLEGILYPDSFSFGALGVEFKLGGGAIVLGKSSLREVWTSDHYLEESTVAGEAYLLGSLRSAVCLNLAKGVEEFALTESGKPDPSPIWSLLNPFYFIVDLQAGPGLSTQEPKLKFRTEANLGLEYRF